MDRPYIICLIPIKNEAWILDRCLQTASLWADKIIVADQMSDDGSPEIAVKYPKVQLIQNASTQFNEPERQKLLIDAARQIPYDGKKLLIALDADEMLTANWLDSPEWQAMLDAPIGTVFQFSLLNLRPDMKKYWHGGTYFWGLMDDGKSTHKGSLIHSTRMPIPADAPCFICNNIKVFHYQYTDWKRMQSKHRWYQCFELLNRPNIRPLSIFRIYHHMYALRENQLYPIEDKWFTDYEKLGIDMRTIHQDKTYRWDKTVADWFQEYGKKRFASLYIWQNEDPKNDPRTWYQRLVHQYLLITQMEAHRPSIWGKFIRVFDKILKLTL